MNPSVISWLDVDSGDPARNPDDSQFRYRVLAEGDSWLSLRGIPTSNLAVNLEFDAQTLVVNCGMPGDTLRNMSQLARNQGFRKMLGPTPNFGYRWDAILLSGGGNDLIDDADRIIVPAATPHSTDPADYCDAEALKKTFRVISDGYQRIVEFRDNPKSRSRDVPVIVHTYDFFTPRNSPARVVGLPLMGPWLFSALMRDQIPSAMWQPIADHLLALLERKLLALAKKLPAFHVVPTQGTLLRADLGSTLISHDWADEIHPTARGYAKIADKISAEFARLVQP